MLKPYYTCIVPGVPPKYRTDWHPSTEDASPLSRGAFDTVGDAIEWAKRLNGTPYSIRRIDPEEE